MQNMIFFLIQIPLIEIIWIWLKLNPFTTFYDLMHEALISAFFWAVLRQNLLHAFPNTLLLQKINKSRK